MTSCSYLDPASLLAQCAISIRLGRRVGSCSHLLVATARRAPLNESNVQGNVKQPSTVASAPAQVFQSVGADRRRHAISESGDTSVDRMVPLRDSGSRSHSTLPGRNRALQAAVGSAVEQCAEELVPHLRPTPQPPEELPQVRVRAVGPTKEARAQQPGHQWAFAHCAQAQHGPTTLVGIAHSEASFVQQNPSRNQQQRQRFEPRRPRLLSTAPVHPLRPDIQDSAGKKELQRSYFTGTHHGRSQHPLQATLQPREPVGDCTQGVRALAQTDITASAAAASPAAVAVIGLEGDAAATAITSSPHGGFFTVGMEGAYPEPSRILPPHPGVSAAQLSDFTTTAAPTITTAALGARQAGLQAEASYPAEIAHPTESDGPTGGRWGGLESELVACRTVHSVHRFLHLLGPRAKCSLLGNAIVHLSHLTAEELPDGVVERQLLASLLDELMQRLQGSVQQLSRGLLVAMVCAMSRLRCYYGPLLQEVAATARDVATALTTRQIAGLMWAFGRYHRDFSFRLEPGWSSDLLHAVTPRLPQATSQDAAMMLYGCALLRAPPPSVAFAGLLAALLAGMPAACGPELSMSIWALATLRLDPGQEWMSAFLKRCDTATRTFASGVAVSNVLYGLAAMQVQPPAPWMLNFLWQAQRRMNTMDAQSLVMLAWALGRVRYRPDRKWLARFFHYSRSTVLLRPQDPHLSGKPAGRLAAQLPSQAVLQAASQRQLEIWRRQQNRLHQRQQQRVGSLGATVGTAASASTARRPTRDGDGGGCFAALPPQAYNILLWACVRLSCRPMGQWLKHLCDAVQPHLASWPAQELPALLWSLARLRWRPHDAWMTEFCSATRSGLPLFQPPHSVMTLLALSKLCSCLGYRVSDDDLANALAQRLAPYYSRLQTTTLISVVLAVSRITPRVRHSRLEESLAALLERVQTIGVGDGSQAAPYSHAAPRVANRGDDAWSKQQEKQQEQDEAMMGKRKLQPQLELQVLSSESAELGGRPLDRPQLQPTATAVAAAAPLPPLTARECANAVFAVGCVAIWPAYNDAMRGLCGQLLRELLPRAYRLAPALNGVDLVLLLHGVTMARMRVSPQWLRRHEEQALRLLQTGKLHPSQLRELLRAYHALDYVVEMLPGAGAGMAAPGVEGLVGAGAGVDDAGESRCPGSVGAGVGVFLKSDVRLCGSEDEDMRNGRSALGGGLSEAAKARRRRFAQTRRRRVTAAIEHRVLVARRRVAEGQRSPDEEQRLRSQPQAVCVTSNCASDGRDSANMDALLCLQSAERELRMRRKTIQRFSAMLVRGRHRSPRGPPEEGGM